jgi:hypothetical protein
MEKELIKQVIEEYENSEQNKLIKQNLEDLNKIILGDE